MYDMAKRSMAFAVATGGLLLTGPACAVAAAAEDPGAPSGSVSAQAEVGNHMVAQAVTAQVAAPSGGVGSNNSVDAPIDLGLNLCGNGVSLLSSSGSSGCSTTSGTAAAATATAAAVTPAAQQGGVLSGNSVRTPITLSLNACGNGASVASAAGSVLGSACTVDHASSLRSGVGLGGASDAAGVAAGNSLNLPISVPLNVCGNKVDLLSDAVSNAISCVIAEGFTASAGSGQSASGSTASGGASSQSGTTGADGSGTQGSNSTAQANNTVQSNGAAQSNGTAQSNAGPSDSNAAGQSSSIGSNAAQTQTQTQTTTTTTTTTTTDQAQTSTTTDQTQASSISLPVSVPAIRPGGSASGSGDSSIAQSAPHAVTTPAALPVPDSAPHATPVPLVVHPQVIWPRPQTASAPLAPHGTSQTHQQADPAAGQLAHTGAAIIAPFGVAGVALGAGAALRATGHHRR